MKSPLSHHQYMLFSRKAKEDETKINGIESKPMVK